MAEDIGVPLHVEQVADACITFARVNFPAALSNVRLETDAEIPLAPPDPQSYFIGEPARYRPFACPALFVDPVRTHRPLDRQGNALLYQEHTIQLVLVVEATTVETLTRASWRYAQALDALINQFELAPPNIAYWSTWSHVGDVSYGDTWVNTHSDLKTFRKDVTLAMIVKHWDQFLQLPLQTRAGLIARGQAPAVGDIVNSTVNLLLSAGTTTLAQYLASAGGNFGVSVFFSTSAPVANLVVTLSWTDGGGAQSVNLVSGAQGGGSYWVAPMFFNVIAGATISVTATASAGGVVTMSAMIEALG